MNPILSIRNLEYTYPTGTKALNGVNLDIHRGERVAVLGSNGSGKSTLFLCLNGVLKIQSGEIRFEDKLLQYNKRSLIEIRRNVGIVFQDPETQLFCVDVYQEVAFGPYNLGLRGEALTSCVTENLERADVLDLKDKPPHFLSGGQKKRVSIAAVLSMSPQILIFDEPTAALDPVHATQLMNQLEQFTAQGLTVIMSTHDVNTAYHWADRVVVMDRGQICANDTPEKIFSRNELLKQSGLSKPMVLRMYEKLVFCGILPQDLPIPRSMTELETYLDLYKE